MIIRTALPEDAGALAEIYGHACLHGSGTFEEEPPSPDEMASRLASVTGRGLPYLIVGLEGRAAGLAYAAPFRLRAAYRYTVEDSVYIAPWAKGRGVGKAALTAVIAACEKLGLRQMMAVIGGSDNAGSIALHRSLGFEQKGVMPAVGYKHDAWADIVLMQRPLNSGADTPPDAEGLALRGV